MIFAVGDRWADLAIASLSLDWNYGEGHQHELFDAYGIAPDEERVRYYPRTVAPRVMTAEAVRRKSIIQAVLP